MADSIKKVERDFFISFNGADLDYAEAINTALREAGFATYFHPVDIPPGGNIPKWMDDALLKSGQMLALFSPNYIAEGAVYSESERYARFWQDTRGSEFKLIPVVLRETEFSPLLAVYKRIDAANKTPEEAAVAVVAELKKHQPLNGILVCRVWHLPGLFCLSSLVNEHRGIAAIVEQHVG